MPGEHCVHLQTQSSEYYLFLQVYLRPKALAELYAAVVLAMFPVLVQEVVGTGYLWPFLSLLPKAVCIFALFSSCLLGFACVLLTRMWPDNAAEMMECFVITKKKRWPQAFSLLSHLFSLSQVPAMHTHLSFGPLYWCGVLPPSQELSTSRPFTHSPSSAGWGREQ